MGGAGGGAIRLTVTGTLQVGGRISARGQAELVRARVAGQAGASTSPWDNGRLGCNLRQRWCRQLVGWRWRRWAYCHRI